MNVLAVPGIPSIQPGDDLAEILIGAIVEADIEVQPQDVLVVAQKVVSKGEDRYASLLDVEPSDEACDLASVSGKDPRFVELILREADAVLRAAPGIVVVRHKLGVVVANAGIDHSNIDRQDNDDRVLLLPHDPDASARRIRHALSAQFSAEIAVVVSDSIGRAWRKGTIGTAIGSAGLPSLVDLRGERDLFGNTLAVSEVAFADQIASAAVLVMGEGAEGNAAVLVRGLEWDQPECSAANLVRPREMDLFQ